MRDASARVSATAEKRELKRQEFEAFRRRLLRYRQVDPGAKLTELARNFGCSIDRVNKALEGTR